MDRCSGLRGDTPTSVRTLPLRISSKEVQPLPHSRVSVGVLDAAQMSLEGEEHAGVAGAAVLQEGGGGLLGGLRRSAAESGGCKRKKADQR